LLSSPALIRKAASETASLVMPPAGIEPAHAV
jgi:hypothetical protein